MFSFRQLLVIASIFICNISCYNAKTRVYTDSKYVESMVRIIGKDTVDIYCDECTDISYYGLLAMQKADVIIIEGNGYRPELREAIVQEKWSYKTASVINMTEVGVQKANDMSLKSSYVRCHPIYNPETPLVLSIVIADSLSYVSDNQYDQSNLRGYYQNNASLFYEDYSRVRKQINGSIQSTRVFNSTPKLDSRLLSTYDNIDYQEVAVHSDKECHCSDHRHTSIGITYDYKQLLDSNTIDFLLVEEEDQEFFTSLRKNSPSWTGNIIVVQKDFSAADSKQFVRNFFKPLQDIIDLQK